MFIYRPDMYGLTSPDGESLEDFAEIIIDKQRNGPPSSVYLRWNAFSATYESFGPEWRSPMQLPLYQIDAFTGSEFKGNPAAVMPLKTWLDDGTLQAIATENNLSATAFFALQRMTTCSIYAASRQSWRYRYAAMRRWQARS